mgnify:CR=1 FL=1
MIKRNSRFFIICCVVVLFTTTWIVLQIVWSNTESRCTVKVEDDLFSIGMESMNESRSESFQLEEGISVAVYVVHLDGELDIYITDSNGTVVYEGHNPEIGSFLVNITEDGRYTMTVEGKRAKGSISFQILRNEEKTK